MKTAGIEQCTYYPMQFVWILTNHCDELLWMVLKSFLILNIMKCLPSNTTAQKRACNTATCVTHRLADFLSRSGGMGHRNFVPTSVGAQAFGKRRRRSPEWAHGCQHGRTARWDLWCSSALQQMNDKCFYERPSRITSHTLLKCPHNSTENLSYTLLKHSRDPHD